VWRRLGDHCAEFIGQGPYLSGCEEVLRQQVAGVLAVRRVLALPRWVKTIRPSDVPPSRLGA
jgi:hypothetical protein